MSEYIQAVKDIREIITGCEKDIRNTRGQGTDTYTFGQLDILYNLRIALDTLIAIREKK